ncbi:MAG: 16S rRNA (cytidine(1402)-2'-O)-methyltransferase [Xanthobacteraceae bacterium]|nr:16S rRNA (cytidine(1402)-2'-O)-methyltransferase [Xanthobacteraceae bacterium]QYK45014.1 MAG: 16S rRNA (cytidine(1402)-2'-O)-methyltransferase [Xanthobacteraceae bacterium]
MGDRRSSKEAEVRPADTAKPARLAPGLYVVATPIGNLRDITLRALDVLRAASLVLCEDTRVTRKLFERHQVNTKLLAYHDHNAESVRPRVLKELEEGAAIALVSDAGTPLVSDPGYKLVAAAIEAGHKIFPVPGASAALAALVAAGLPTDRFFFEGFLPPKSGARKSRLVELQKIPATLVFYESGPRLAESLADMSATLGAREAAVCRELTKAFEEIRRGTLAILAAHYTETGAPKGEIVVIVSPPGEEAVIDDAALDAKIESALKKLSLKDAAAAIAAETGLPRKGIYARALALAEKKK